MLDPGRGAIVDLRNGFLFAPGDGAQTDIYLSLFKRRDARYVIALKYYASNSQDFSYLECYIYQAGSWADVTKSVIPVNLSDELKYELPRYGKVIRVRDKKGKRLYDLVWRGQKFRVRK